MAGLGGERRRGRWRTLSHGRSTFSYTHLIGARAAQAGIEHPSAAAIVPVATANQAPFGLGDYFYINYAESERCLVRGGNWVNGGVAGVFYSGLSNPRSLANGSIGGRSAFYE